MIHNVKDSDQYIYHYTSAETAEKFILANGTLRFGSFRFTNDPRESKDWEFSLSSSQHDLGDYDCESVSRDVSAALKDQAYLACFVRDKENLTGDCIRDSPKRGCSRPRMWAQYGGNHKGVCIVFDKSRFIDTSIANQPLANVFCGSVSYKDRTFAPRLGLHGFNVEIDRLEALGLETYAFEFLTRYRDKLFFEKLTDWRDEREWRCITLASHASPIFVPIQEAVVGIVHGVDMPATVSDQIMARAHKLNPDIQHIGIRWINGAPWYDLGNPFWSPSRRKSLPIS